MQKQEYIRASEIGSFLFCEKAWGYNRQGVKPSPRCTSRDAGIAFHRAHGGVFHGLAFSCSSDCCS